MEVATTAMWATFLAASLGLLAWRRRKHAHQNWVPCAPGGLLANTLEYAHNPLAFVERHRALLGGAFMAKLAFKRVVFLDGTYARAFFAQPESTLSFKEAMRRTLVPEMTVGVHLIEEPWHVPVLRVALRARPVAEHYVPGIAQEFAKAARRHLPCDHGQVVVMDSGVSDFCWRMVAQFSSASFFGPDMCQDNDELLDIFVTLHLSCFKVINAAAVLPAFLAKLAARDIAAQKDKVRRMVAKEVQRRRRQGGDAGGEDGAVAHSDILGEILHGAKDPSTAEPVSDERLADYMVSLIFASMSTTAGVMTHVIYDLAGRGRRHREALRAEAAAALVEGKIGPSFLERVPLLSAFIRESVRLSSLPLQGVRWSMKDVELNGLLIPKGCLVSNSGILAHLSEESFPNPNAFNPGRFLNEQGGLLADMETNGFAPFGMGRHVCPGRHFAVAEVKVAAALLLQEFEFETLSGGVPTYAHLPTETLRKDEPVRFKRL